MEGTLAPKIDAVPEKFKRTVEVAWTMRTGVFRSSQLLQNNLKVVNLKTMFGEILIRKVSCELRQDAMIGDSDGDIQSTGHVYCALIPSSKNTDTAVGTSANVVNSVPNKQAFPLSAQSQCNQVFNFDLEGYELDLAQDPRKGQGVCLYLGNSGIVSMGSSEVNLCSVTWRVELECTGSSTLW